jgi:hypothetical protein
MRARVFGALLLVQASAASAEVTFLRCTLPDIQGKPMLWALKLNEEAGLVEVSRGSTALNKQAVFGPRTVTFKLLRATIEINRVDGTIKQTPIGKDGARAGRGQCAVSAKRAF